MMGVTVEQYENTPALTIDWDMEFSAVEQRAEKNLQDNA